MEFFDHTHTSDINAKYKALDEIQYLAGQQIPGIFQNLLILVFRGIVIIKTNGYLGGIVLGFLLFQGAIEMHLDRRVALGWDDMLGTERACDRVREEAFSLIRTVKEFSSEDEEQQRFCGALERDRAVRARLVHLWALRCGASVALVACSGTLVHFYGLRRVLVGSSTVGEVAAFALLAGSVKDAANGLLTACHQAAGKARRLGPALDLIERAPAAPPEAGAVLDRAAVRGEVALRGVRFAYPSRPDLEVPPRILVYISYFNH